MSINRESGALDDKLAEGVVTDDQQRTLALRIANSYRMNEAPLPRTATPDGVKPNYLTGRLIPTQDGQLSFRLRDANEAPISGYELLMRVLDTADRIDNLNLVNGSVTVELVDDTYI